ncbi:hypothetical protein P9112_002381 [Eukaryota sp. TZLM1-RC]
MEPRYNTSIEATPLLKPQIMKTPRTLSTGQRTANTGTSRETSSCYVVAVFESKNRAIGLAAVDLKSPNLHLCTLTDTSAYLSTLSMLMVWDPVEIVLAVPSTTPLNSLITESFLGASIASSGRKNFSDKHGLDIIEKVCFERDRAVIVTEISKNRAVLAAVSAVITYVQQIQTVEYSANSLKVTVKIPDGSLLIDPSSASSLELFQSSVSSSTHCVFKALDHTKTSMGRRLLRMTLAQPPSDLATIESRLDAVQALLANEQVFFELENVLAEVPDIEFILSQYSSYPPPKRTPTVLKNIAQTMVMTKIVLKNTFSLYKLLIQVKEVSVFGAICEVLADPSLELIRDRIDEILDDEVFLAKGSAAKSVLAFAVKPGIDCLLDVARHTYSETIEDIQDLVNTIKQDYVLTSLKLHYSAKKGHYLSVLVEELPKHGTIKGFIQNQRQGKRMNFSLTQLESLNSRSHEALEEVMLMMSNVLLELVDQIRPLLSVLLLLSDGIALVDVVRSYAAFVASQGTAREYTRPELTVDGPIAIKAGRHPLLESMVSNFVANDFFMSDSISTILITGINMAGKTTLLRQIAMIVLLAHIGCYVPATFCSIPLLNRLIVRLGFDDSFEVGDSTFGLEMREIAHGIRATAELSPSGQKKVLMLIDELGRATSTIEGLSLAWSISEYLIVNQVKSILTTHFSQLSELSLHYPHAKCCHMGSKSVDGFFKPLYKLTDGSLHTNSIHGYGIQAAELAGFPQDVLIESQKIRKSLLTNGSGNASILTKLHELSQSISMLKYSSLDNSGLRSMLSSLKQNLLDLMEKAELTKL